jgi:hypothetical protein
MEFSGGKTSLSFEATLEAYVGSPQSTLQCSQVDGEVDRKG